MNRIGSLCTGYGGLDMAVEAVLGGEMVWYSEFEHHPSKLLEQRFPGVPNHGDLTKIDWNTVEPIDILTGGYPCQPFSQAGKRKGEDDPRHLWPYIREAVRVLRPRITILENVAGHRSKGFSTVLRDCAEDGLDVRWVSVRASDAGAPHQRERLFFAVTDPDGFGWPTPGRASEVPGTGTDGCFETTSGSSGERHGEQQDDRVAGRVDRCSESQAWQRKRPREVSSNRSAEGGRTRCCSLGGVRACHPTLGIRNSSRPISN